VTCCIYLVVTFGPAAYVDVLRWLVEHYPDKCRKNLMEVAAWEGHFAVVRYLGEHTNQRAARWGLGVAMRQGWLRALLVLMQKYPNPEVGAGIWGRLNTIVKAFDKLLSQISYQYATPTSLLWTEALESLKLFHSSGLFGCVSLMLGQALQRGYQKLAQQSIEHRDENERCKYVAIAAKRWNVVLLRWLLANGTPIDKFSAIQLATEHSFSEYAEVASYLSEGDRVQVVCEAITERKWSKLLQWTLKHTSFIDDNASATVCDAIKHAPNGTVQWLRENLSDAETLEWCV